MPYRLAIALSLVLCDFVSLSHSAYLIYNTFTENASLFLNFLFFIFSRSTCRFVSGFTRISCVESADAFLHFKQQIRISGHRPERTVYLHLERIYRCAQGFHCRNDLVPIKKCLLSRIFLLHVSVCFLLFQVFQRGGSLRQQSRGILQQRF